MRIGEMEMVSLMSWKSLRASSSYSILVSLFNMSLMGLAISAKLDMNLWTKLILPINDLNSLMLKGYGIFWITFTLSRSMDIPFSKMIWPNSLPLEVPKIHFFGFKEIPNFLHLSKIILKSFHEKIIPLRALLDHPYKSK